VGTDIGAVTIDEDDLLDLGLERLIYSKERVEEFLQFQDSQGTRKAYLAEAVELAYSGQAADMIWDGVGLGISDKKIIPRETE
jgi:hypothetical protein